jgi:hypothetical protein
MAGLHDGRPVGVSREETACFLLSFADLGTARRTLDARVEDIFVVDRFHQCAPRSRKVSRSG